MVALIWRLRGVLVRVADHLDAGDFAAADAELCAAASSSKSDRIRGFIEIHRSYLERRQSRAAAAIERLSKVARDLPELRVWVSAELSVCHALSGNRGAAKIMLPDDRRASVARAVVCARREEYDAVASIRMPWLLPWWRPILRHERRLFALVTAFSLERVPNRSPGGLLADATPAFDAEFEYLCAEWPEMAAFVSRRGLGGSQPHA